MALPSVGPGIHPRGRKQRRSVVVVLAVLVVVVSLAWIPGEDYSSSSVRVSKEWSGTLTQDTSLAGNSTTTTTTTTTSPPPPPSTDDDNNKNDPRPTGLKVAIVGDSLSRYFYLSLAYFLKHGKWALPGSPLLEKVKDPSPGAWNDWLAATHGELRPHERACDCYRYWTKQFKWYQHCENRYFHDPHRDNLLVFVTRFGGNPFHGHSEPSLRSMADGSSNSLNQTMRPYDWKHDSWEGLVSGHLARLRPTKPTMLLFNQGHWKGHDLRDQKVLASLKAALAEHGMQGVYRTTTFRSDETAAKPRNDLRKHDAKACAVFGCLNVSWTAGLGEEEYVDPVHFRAGPNNRMVQQFLSEFHGWKLPPP